MNEREEGIRQKLSHLKNHLFSFDFQDIYRLRNTDENMKGQRGENRPATRFRVYSDKMVLDLVEEITPLSVRGRAFALNRLQAGDRAFVGFHNDRPVCYGWLMFEEIEITFGVFEPLPSGVAFAYNIHTARSHRRRGAMTDFYRFVSSYLEKQGMKALYCGIASGNRASVAAHLKTGFEKAGHFYSLKLLGICFTRACHDHTKRFYINRVKYSS